MPPAIAAALEKIAGVLDPNKPLSEGNGKRQRQRKKDKKGKAKAGGGGGSGNGAGGNGNGTVEAPRDAVKVVTESSNYVMLGLMGDDPHETAAALRSWQQGARPDPASTLRTR